MGVIRLVLSLSVLHTHSGANVLGQGLMPGYIAVESFYIISGFYMAMVLNEKYVARHDYVTFLQQRFFRLYPTYFVVLVLSLFGDWVASSAHLETRDNASSIFGRLSELNLPSLLILAASNLLILGQDMVMFLGVGRPAGSSLRPISRQSAFRPGTSSSFLRPGALASKSRSTSSHP